MTASWPTLSPAQKVIYDGALAHQRGIFPQYSDEQVGGVIRWVMVNKTSSTLNDVINESCSVIVTSGEARVNELGKEFTNNALQEGRVVTRSMGTSAPHTRPNSPTSTSNAEIIQLPSNEDDDLLTAMKLSEQQDIEDQLMRSSKKLAENENIDRTMQEAVMNSIADNFASTSGGVFNAPGSSSDPRTRLRVNVEDWSLPVGLVNNCNTCWLNSIVQTLFHQPALQHAIMFEVQPDRLATDHLQHETDIKCVRVLGELRRVFALLQAANQKFINIKTFFSLVNNDYVNGVARQQDSSEMAVEILDLLERASDIVDLPVDEVRKLLAEDVPPPDPTPAVDPPNLGAEQTAVEMADVSSSSDATLPIIYGPEPRPVVRQVDHRSEDNFIRRLFGIEVMEIDERTGPNKGKVHQKRADSIFMPHFMVDSPSSQLHDCLQRDRWGDEDDADLVTSYWHSAPSHILPMYVRRYVYRNGNCHKLFHRLSFDRHVYFDRYLLSNRERVLPLRPRQRAIKHEADKVKAWIDSYDTVDPPSVLRRLNDMREYFADAPIARSKSVAEVMETGAGEEEEISKLSPVAQFEREHFRPLPPDCRAFPPTNVLSIDGDTSRRLRAVLDQEVLAVEAQLVDKRARYGRLLDDYSIVFEPDAAMKQHGYTLRSVIVHSGSGPSSGHYYTFVHRPSRRQWVKINDREVTVCTWEDVMAHGYGGDGLATAYTWFYTSDKEQVTPHVDGEETTVEQMVEARLAELPTDLRDLVTSENAVFAKECHDFARAEDKTEDNEMHLPKTSLLLTAEREAYDEEVQKEYNEEMAVEQSTVTNTLIDTILSVRRTLHRSLPVTQTDSSRTPLHTSIEDCLRPLAELVRNLKTASRPPTNDEVADAYRRCGGRIASAQEYTKRTPLDLTLSPDCRFVAAIPTAMHTRMVTEEGAKEMAQRCRHDLLIGDDEESPPTPAYRAAHVLLHRMRRCAQQLCNAIQSSTVDITSDRGEWTKHVDVLRCLCDCVVMNEQLRHAHGWTSGCRQLVYPLLVHNAVVAAFVGASRALFEDMMEEVNGDDDLSDELESQIRVYETQVLPWVPLITEQMTHVCLAKPKTVAVWLNDAWQKTIEMKINVSTKNGAQLQDRIGRFSEIVAAPAALPSPSTDSVDDPPMPPQQLTLRLMETMGVAQRSGLFDDADVFADRACEQAAKQTTV